MGNLVFSAKLQDKHQAQNTKKIWLLTTFDCCINVQFRRYCWKLWLDCILPMIATFSIGLRSLYSLDILIIINKTIINIARSYLNSSLINSLLKRVFIETFTCSDKTRSQVEKFYFQFSFEYCVYLLYSSGHHRTAGGEDVDSSPIYLLVLHVL